MQRGRILQISIPYLQLLQRLINNKIITGSNKKDKNNQDPTAASMNTMNNIMPFMSGIFCFMFPIGVGLYWVAGNVFRIIQGLFINAYFKKVGIESIAEKNIEKRNKKLAKKGIDVNSTKMQQVAKRVQVQSILTLQLILQRKIQRIIVHIEHHQNRIYM